VKLHQFDPEDRTHVRIATNKTDPVEAFGRPGVKVVPLFKDHRETVRIEEWAPSAAVSLDVTDGLEVFVLRGGFIESADTLTEWDWLRLPDGARLEATAGKTGARVWIKAGHLADMV
ncbi:MAG: cupin domain-containing protein, partial [Pseudomonadota bacterium]